MVAHEPTIESALVEQLAEWQVHTRALMTSMLELAGYFGPRTARASLERAFERPKWLVEQIAYPQPPLVGMPSTTHRFRTRSKRLATILSPLVELINGPIPSFVALTRAIPDGMPTLLAFGEFSGRFALGVTYPLFEAYPELAPEEWLRVHSGYLLRRRRRSGGATSLALGRRKPAG